MGRLRQCLPPLTHALQQLHMCKEEASQHASRMSGCLGTSNYRKLTTVVRCQRAHHLGNSCALQVQGDPSHIFIRPIRHLPSRAIPAHVAGIARPSFSAFRPYCTQLKGLLPHSGLSRLAHILGVGAADVPLALLSGWLCCQGLVLLSKGSDQFQLLISLLRCLARHILMPKAISAHACKLSIGPR